MRTWAFCRVVAVPALLAAACGTETTTGASSSIVSTAVSPNPATATASADAAYQWTASFTLTITAASTGVKVNAANAVVYQAAGGIITATVDTANVRVLASAATNHIDANASLPIAYNVSYTLPDGSKGVLVRITLSVTDDNGNSSSGNVDVTVT